MNRGDSLPHPDKSSYRNVARDPDWPKSHIPIIPFIRSLTWLVQKRHYPIEVERCGPARQFQSPLRANGCSVPDSLFATSRERYQRISVNAGSE
jgi:hypothetical protein